MSCIGLLWCHRVLVNHQYYIQVKYKAENSDWIESIISLCTNRNLQIYESSETLQTLKAYQQNNTWKHNFLLTIISISYLILDRFLSHYICILLNLYLTSIKGKQYFFQPSFICRKLNKIKNKLSLHTFILWFHICIVVSCTWFFYYASRVFFIFNLSMASFLSFWSYNEWTINDYFATYTHPIHSLNFNYHFLRKWSKAIDSTKKYLSYFMCKWTIIKANQKLM